MKKLISFSVLLLSFHFFSCCTQPQVENKGGSSGQINIPPPPQDIAINRSTVTATIQDIMKGDNGFTIRALISQVEDDGAYQSLATAGRTYTLTPLFYINDEGNMPDNEKNRRFKTLLDKNAGDTFKAYIFFERMNGWFIQDLIN